MLHHSKYDVILVSIIRFFNVIIEAMNKAHLDMLRMAVIEPGTR